MVISISGFVGNSDPFIWIFMFWSVNSALFSQVFVADEPSDGANRIRSPGTCDERRIGMRMAAGIRVRWWSMMVFARVSRREGGTARRGGADVRDGFAPGRTRR